MKFLKYFFCFLILLKKIKLSDSPHSSFFITEYTKNPIRKNSASTEDSNTNDKNTSSKKSFFKLFKIEIESENKEDNTQTDTEITENNIMKWFNDKNIEAGNLQNFIENIKNKKKIEEIHDPNHSPLMKKRKNQLSNNQQAGNI